MKRFWQQPCLILTMGLLLTCGCSWSRGNLAKNSSEAAGGLNDEDSGGVKHAIAETSEGDPTGPPSQPGAKPKAGSRKKLTGWLNSKEPKRESIPLDRTDTESQSDSEESLADDGNNWWKQSDAPITADSSTSAKKSKSGTDALQLDQ